MAGTPDKAGRAGRAGERHNAAFVVGSILGGVIGAAAALWKAPQTGEELRRTLTSGGEDEVRSGLVVSSVRTGSGRVLDSARTGSVRLLSSVKAGSTRVSRADSGASEAASPGSTSTASFSNRVLSFVEKTAAPIVGVKLGQTANGSGPAAGESSARITPIRGASATTAEHPVGDEGIHSQDQLTFGTYSGRSTAAPSTGTASTISSDSATRQTATPSATSIDQGAMSDAATPSPASPDIPEGVPGHVPTTEELVTPATPLVPEPDTAQQSSGTTNLFPEPDTKGTERT